MPAVTMHPIPALSPAFADDLREIDAAREAALGADHDGDLTEALEMVVERLARGVPLRVVLTELYRAGYRAGWLDGTGDLTHAVRRMHAEQLVADHIQKAA